MSHTCFRPLPDQGHCRGDPALRALPGRQPLSLAAMKSQHRTARVKQKQTKRLSVGTPKDNCLSRKRLPKKTNPIPFTRQQGPIRTAGAPPSLPVSTRSGRAKRLSAHTCGWGVCEWSGDGEGRLQEWTRPGCQTPKACPTPSSAVTPAMPTGPQGSYLMPPATLHCDYPMVFSSTECSSRQTAFNHCWIFN